MGRKQKKTSRSLLILLPAAVLILSAALWGWAEYSNACRRQELSGRLTRLGELTTVTRLYRSVFYIREKKNFIQDKSLLFTAEFRVEAGIDLSEGFDLSLRGKRARVLLPRGRILLVDGDDRSLEQIFVKERFSSVDTGDYLPLIGEEADRIRNRALESGIRESAEQRAARIIRGILLSAGLEEAEIRFRSEGPAAVLGKVSP